MKQSSENHGAKLQAVLLCERLESDEQGRHTIYNEFSQCTMGYSQPFTVLVIWRGSEEGEEDREYYEELEIVAPDGRVIASGKNGPFSLKNDTSRQVNSLLLDQVDFTHDGKYDLSIRLLEISGHEPLYSYHQSISVI